MVAIVGGPLLALGLLLAWCAVRVMLGDTVDWNGSHSGLGGVLLFGALAVPVLIISIRVIVSGVRRHLASRRRPFDSRTFD